MLVPKLKAELLVAVLLSTIFIGACSKRTKSNSGGKDNQRESKTSVPDKYKFLFTGGIAVERVPKIWNSMPFTEIQLERTPCFGECPAYVVTFSIQGDARYEGREFVRKKGKYNGIVEIWDYGRLCHAIEEFGILDGKREFSANWTDSPTTILRVRRKGEQEYIEISDYSSQGPIQLWSVFAAIDGVASLIDWKPDN